MVNSVGLQGRDRAWVRDDLPVWSPRGAPRREHLGQRVDDYAERRQLLADVGV